jgi:hypothetical protein
MWGHELNNLRIQRLELEQQGACHEKLQAMDAAIRMREQQLAGIGAGVPRRAEVREADEEKWWKRHPPYIKRPCGHLRGSVLRDCCKLADAGLAS